LKERETERHRANPRRVPQVGWREGGIKGAKETKRKEGEIEEDGDRQ